MRALAVTEELALHQLARDRATVDGREAPPSSAAGVDRAGVHFLADPGFTQNQQLAIGPGQPAQTVARDRQRRRRSGHRPKRRNQLRLDGLQLQGGDHAKQTNLVSEEDQRAIAQADAALDPDVVEERAVLAAQIGELEPPRRDARDSGVRARHQRIGHHQRRAPRHRAVRGTAADFQIVAHEDQAAGGRRAGRIGGAHHQQNRGVRQFGR